MGSGTGRGEELGSVPSNVVAGGETMVGRS